MITLDEIYDYVWRHDPVPNEDENVVYELAEMIYEQLTMHNPTLDDVDKILEEIHEKARRGGYC